MASKYTPVEWKDEIPGVQNGTLINKERIDTIQTQYLKVAGVQVLDALPSVPEKDNNVCIWDNQLWVWNGREWSTFTNFRGSVNTYADLPADASRGDIYLILSTGHIWKFEGTEWIDAGMFIDIESLEADVEEAITTERTERVEADNNLNSKIEQETADRISADQNLNTKIGQEIADRLSAMEGLNTSIEALLGAVIPRGIINVQVPTITQLNQYMQTNYQRAPLRGDMVRDLRNMEWYFDGTSWDEIGQSHIATASETVQGIAYLTNQEGTREDKAASQALLNKVKGDLQEEIANVEGMSPEDKAKLDSLPTNPVRSVNSKLPDINGNVVIDVGDGTGGGTGEAVQEIFFGTCTTSATTVAKIVTVEGLTELKVNMMFAIKFSSGNSTTSSTMTINDTGTYGMRFQGTISTLGALKIVANETVLFLFDGTYFQKLTPSPLYTSVLGSRVLATNPNKEITVTDISATEANLLKGLSVNVNQAFIDFQQQINGNADEIDTVRTDLQQQINEIDTGGGGGEGGPAEQSILHVMTWAQATAKALSITNGLFTAYIDHLDAGSPFGEDGLNGSIEVTFYSKIDSIYAVATLHGKGGQASRLYVSGAWGEWKVLGLTTLYGDIFEEFFSEIIPFTPYQHNSEFYSLVFFDSDLAPNTITVFVSSYNSGFPENHDEFFEMLLGIRPVPEGFIVIFGGQPAMDIIPPKCWYMVIPDTTSVTTRYFKRIRDLKLGGI